MVIPQIETAEGLANVEAIAAVPGVDALWLGHFDLTNFLGIPGAVRASALRGASMRIVAACDAHGKTAGVPRHRRRLGARLRRHAASG